MRISDWSSDVCSADLVPEIDRHRRTGIGDDKFADFSDEFLTAFIPDTQVHAEQPRLDFTGIYRQRRYRADERRCELGAAALRGHPQFGLHLIVEPRERSEEHTSELQSLMSSSSAVFCLKK